MTLKDAIVGNDYKITSILCSVGSERRKLMEMGVTVGHIITFIKRAPLGDPIQIRVRGYSLAIRNECAECIIVEDYPSTDS